MNKQKVFCALLPVFFFVPLCILKLYPAYHFEDMRTFFEWGEHFKTNWRDIYVSCEKCNYPFLGTVFSAGIGQIFQDVSARFGGDPYLEFRIVLAILAGVNSLLVLSLLRLLKCAYPFLTTLLIAVLPSTFILEYTWGNIDGIVQFFLLGTLVCFAKSMLLVEGSPWWQLRYVALGWLGFFSLPLVKQTSLFSLPALFLAAVYATACCWKALPTKFRLFALLPIPLSLGLFLLPDLFLHLPPPFHFHLEYIWLGGGSEHGNKISGNGFNIWMMLGRPMSASSLEPFSHYKNWTPQRAGYVLFILTALVSLLWLFLATLRSRFLFAGQHMATRRWFLVCVLLFLALSNLEFNLFLTGTHERYLAHFYPFLIVALASLSSFGFNIPLRAFLGSVFMACLYGGFVSSIIWSPPRLLTFVSLHLFVGSLHLVLFTLLMLLCYDILIGQKQIVALY